MCDAEPIKFIKRFIVRFDGLVSRFEVEDQHILILYVFWVPIF